MLLLDDHRFVKHAGVRGAVHKQLIKTGRVSQEFGKKYDELMKARMGADCLALSRCTPDDAAGAVASAEGIVTALKELLPPGVV